jgi:hypothetical protein
LSPDLLPYSVLLSSFLDGRLNPVELQVLLVTLFKNDQVVRPHEVYEPLNDLFLAAEAYETNPDNRDRYTVDEDELYRVATSVQDRLVGVFRD